MGKAGIGGVPPKQRGQINPRRRVAGGEATASPLIERGYVNITLQGTRAQFVWHVKDIDGPVELALARATQVVGIPRYGDWHSILNVPVNSVRADPVDGSPSQAYVTVEYGLQVEGGGGWFGNDPSETAPAAVEIVSTVQSTMTDMDVNGNPIVVYHEEPVPEGEEGAPFTRPQGGEVAYQQPLVMVIFRRRERVSPGIDIPGGRGGTVDYVNHVNEDTWFADVAQVWLCSKMDGFSDDNGATWNVTYEFQRRLPNWKAVAWYRDPDTGQPIALPDGMTPDTAIEVAHVQLYPIVDFNTLRLFG